MEFKESKLDLRSREEQLLQERFSEILKNFNWDLFYEILDKHKSKSGLKVLTTQEEELRKAYLDEIFNNPKRIANTDLKAPSKNPRITFDSGIDSVADASKYMGARGTIRINIKKAKEYIDFVIKKLEQKNAKVDFDIVNICILRIIFHELLHLNGEMIKNRNGYSSINEAITEFLSFKIMLEYVNANGDGLVNITSIMFYKGLFQIYEYDKHITSQFLKILSKMEDVTTRAFMDSLYWAYLNSFDVSNPNFISLLPEEIQTTWERYLALDLKDIKKFQEEAEGIVKDLERLIEENKKKATSI